MKRREFIAGSAALTATMALTGVDQAQAAPPPGRGWKNPRGAPDFGPNVFIFDPSNPAGDIQAQFDAIFQKQVQNEFGTERYAFLLMPGDYALKASVGYYTTVAGLGELPGDVRVAGGIEAWAREEAPGWIKSTSVFWRSLENVSMSNPDNGQNVWAVSQAAPIRRVDYKTGLAVWDITKWWADPWASGGFSADCRVKGVVEQGGQQQWYVRDSDIGGWSRANWSMVFSGTPGGLPPSPQNPPVVNLPTTPVSREKPILHVDKRGKFKVFVPALRRNASGISWANGLPNGKSIPIEDFHIAKPEDGVEAINKALVRGKHLILTPGIYEVAEPIRVRRRNTVIYGLGMATIVPVNGTEGMVVEESTGVLVSGITFEAPERKSPCLMTVGRKGWKADRENPNTLHDIYFRIGGSSHIGRAETALIVNSDHTILDNIWSWRADHAKDAATKLATIGWTLNTANTGLIVNGDDVIATGLFVEHYQKYEVIWNGERGRTIFFQNEKPYDPPDQASYMNGRLKGYASYKVADHVRDHEAWGLGCYSVFFKPGTTESNPDVRATHAYEVPKRPGVRIHNASTVRIAGGGFDHVINEFGPSTDNVQYAPVTVPEYPPS